VLLGRIVAAVLDGPRLVPPVARWKPRRHFHLLSAQNRKDAEKRGLKAAAKAQQRCSNGKRTCLCADKQAAAACRPQRWRASGGGGARCQAAPAGTALHACL
jgi:hypothetical protein